jgi:glycosyltransferase involved in cell wall biosynthesis
MEPVKSVVHVAESDKIGGAARAMYAIHEALNGTGWVSRVVVGRKASLDADVLSFRSPSGRAAAMASKFVDQQLLRAVCRDTDEPITLNLLGSPIGRVVRSLKPTIVHVHWVGNSFMTPRALARLPDPTVWTLWDMWPFTGGCHYSWGCDRHANRCGHCPITRSSHAFDATGVGLLRKRVAWKKKRFHVVAISQWLADQARKSSLFARSDIDVIVPGVDVTRFRPHAPALARQLLGLPQDRPIIGFVAINPSSPRKGWQPLSAALEMVGAEWTNATNPPLLLRVGAVSTRQRKYAPPLETVDTGFLEDDLSLAIAYSACNVVAVPSTQEAFGRVAIEALACGTPVVAFKDTGVADAVRHNETGYLAENGDAKDLARGLLRFLEAGAPTADAAVRKHARKTASAEFSTIVQAKRYADLYSRLTQRDFAD